CDVGVGLLLLSGDAVQKRSLTGDERFGSADPEHQRADACDGVGNLWLPACENAEHVGYLKTTLAANGLRNDSRSSVRVEDIRPTTARKLPAKQSAPPIAPTCGRGFALPPSDSPLAIRSRANALFGCVSSFY